MLYLFLAVNRLRLQVRIPVKGDSFERTNKLFHQSISLSTSIAACLNKVGDVLFGITLTVKLVERRGLVSMRHAKSIDPFLYKVWCTDASCEILPLIGL